MGLRFYRRINNYLLAWAVLVIASTGAVPVAYGESTNLEALLNDAQDVLTRYQKLDTEAACSAVSARSDSTAAGVLNLYRSCEQQRRDVFNPEAARTKATILRARTDRNPSANDLLAIYAGLEEISSRLFDLANDTNQVNRIDLGMKYGEVAGDASRLAAKLYGEVRERVSALEKACAR